MLMASLVFGQRMGRQSLEQLEQSPAGANVLLFLQTINENQKFTAQEVQKLYSSGLIKKVGVQRLLDVFADIKTNDGQLELWEAQRTDRFSYHLKAKGTKHGDWLDIKLKMEQQRPYKIAALEGIELTRMGPKANEPMIPLKETGPAKKATKGDFSLEDLDSWLNERTENGLFSGVVLIAKDFQPVFHQAYGWASKEYQAPNQLDTKFRLASINKIFTATAILQLIEQGEIKLEDKLHRYIDDFKDPKTADITIRHLLTHSSGWGAYWEHPEYLKNKFQLRSITDYMAFIKNIPLEFSPGKKRQYSNTGYVVLGAVIEKVSGMDYYEYMEKKVFQPAGMPHTSYPHMDEVISKMATNYTKYNYKGERTKEGYPYKSIYFNSSRGVPAGGGVSTTGDLLNFCKAVADNTIVSKESEAFLRSDIGAESSPTDFIFHNGGGQGQNTWMQHNVSSGYSVIVLSNYGPPSTSEVVRFIGKKLDIRIF